MILHLSDHVSAINFNLKLTTFLDTFFPLKLHHIHGVDFQIGLCKGQSTNEINPNPFSILYLLILIILDPNLSVDDFYHEGDSSALLALSVEDCKAVYVEKIFRFYFNLSVIECL
jgi:hypothetical protein